MKDNYTPYQIDAILKVANRRNVTPEYIRRNLDQVFDSLFEQALDEVENMLLEKEFRSMEHYDDIVSEIKRYERSSYGKDRS